MARTKVFDEQEVLKKAMQLFWNKGYNGTSAQDLVDYVGLSRSSLYDTFGDKHGLFIKALELYRTINEAVLEDKLGHAPDVRVAIQQILMQAVEESLARRFTQGCFMVNTTSELALHDSKVMAIVTANRNRTEVIFATAILRGQDKGQISKIHSPTALASFLFNTYTGIRVAARSETASRDMLENIVQVAMSVL
ncbi:TetR/AcrR family transcriptional regulator [Paraflavitalea sp. CAU 1676]|uniref:TetR/AcrR family transcriptional regulator n=1 Tax=Paraflavitalea sp. CAU 1676 TaxID=3032598 RepID=UPI0023DACE20|nr:TetR/AcrR family transcriptional regulator [Paraflavitalea sp. CAU 1676]MDF2190404.1 TetR/AcrR family transcriptional regulator [Paraflavitalea sp. CAU 1676]